MLVAAEWERTFVSAIRMELHWPNEGMDGMLETMSIRDQPRRFGMRCAEVALVDGDLGRLG